MLKESGFYVGQVGAKIRLDTLDDPDLVAAANVVEIHYRLPDSDTTGVWTATVEDSTKLVYTTTSVNDLPSAGEYILQAYMEGVSWKIPGKEVVMLVKEPIIPIT